MIWGYPYFWKHPYIHIQIVPNTADDEGMTSPSFRIMSREMILIKLTPLKINMEHNHGGLEDHVPF